MDEKVGSLEDFSLLMEGIDYVHGENCYGELALQLGMQSDKYNPEKLAMFFIGLNNLTDKTKEVVKICLDCPLELEKFILNKSEQQRYTTEYDLREYLRFKGWSYANICRSFREIRVFLDDM